MRGSDGWPPPWGRALRLAAALIEAKRDEWRKEMVYRVGDRVEVDCAALRYRGERGEVTGVRPANGEVYVRLTGVERPVPFGAGELRLRSSPATAREAKYGLWVGGGGE